MGDDFHQRQPLLGATPNGSAIDLSEEEVNLVSLSPVARNGSAVKIEMPVSDREPKFPRERWKTLVAILFVGANFIATTTSLSITHELRSVEASPLPDLVLDRIPYQSWALDVSEILIMISTSICTLILVFHKHRLILLRRVCLIVGLLYGYRAITMLITVLPAANPLYKCDPQLNHTITGAEVARRVVKILSGFGLSINGQHVYCGDFIFSGHTMILVLAYLITCEYTPRKLWPLHWFSLGLGLAGVVTLLLARGHYSVDVVIAYFVTTRLWYVMSSIIQVAHSAQHKSLPISRVWWWRMCVWFEERVRAPVPNEYEIPRPWQIFYSNVVKTTRTRDPGRDI